MGSMNRRTAGLVLGVGIAFFSSQASGQSLTPVLLAWEGQFISSGMNVYVVTGIRGVQTNAARGFVALFDCDDGHEMFWGKTSEAVGQPEPMTEDGHALGLRRECILNQFGYSTGGQVVYGALVDKGDCFQGKRSRGYSASVWSGDNAVMALEDVPVEPGSSISWGVFSQIGSTASGMPWWLGSQYHNGLTGSATHAKQGLYVHGAQLEERIIPGTTVAGLSIANVRAGAVSPCGQFSIGLVDVAASSPYAAIIQATEDPEGGRFYKRLTSGNVFLRTNAVAKVAQQASPAYRWKEFRSVGILSGETDPDVFWFHGFTDAPSDRDEILGLWIKPFFDVAYREGDIWDGFKIFGPLEHFAVTRGHTAMIWNAAIGSAPAKETLFLDKRKILAVGDAVPTAYSSQNSVITNFLGINSIALTTPWPDNPMPGETQYVTIYFVANVEVFNAGAPLTSDGRASGLYKIDVPVTGAVALCRADFNTSGGLEAQDIFDFLNAWFEGVPSADFDGDGIVDVPDIFAFLNAWFAGC